MIASGSEQSENSHSAAAGFAIDQPKGDDAGDDDDDDDDDLALAALEALDAIEVFKLGNTPISQSSIPPENLRNLIMLLLLIAPLDEQQSISHLLLTLQNRNPGDSPDAPA